MKKTLPIFTCLLFSFIFLIASPTLAISPTPEPTPTENETPTEEKIQGIRDAVKEKVQERLTQVKQGPKRAYVGEITTINNSTLTLETRNNSKQASVDDEETTILNKNRKEIDFEDLSIGDFVIAMGYLGENEVLQTKRLLIINQPETLQHQAAVGIVTDISTDEQVLTIKNGKQNLVYTVEVTSKTTITKKEKDEVEKAKFSEIEIGDRVAAVGTPEENEHKIITAKLIRIIPAQPKTETAPTAKPTVSPTPKE